MQALANVHEIAHEENLQEENLEKQLQNALGTTTSRALIPDGTIPHAHLGTPHFQSHLQLLRHRQNSKQRKNWQCLLHYVVSSLILGTLSLIA